MDMKWINVNEEYTDYLRTFEPRIPNTNYGDDKYKPFFGVLFEKDEFYYITQVSHPQPRHEHMRQQEDFFKILGREFSVFQCRDESPSPSSLKILP